MDYKKYIFRRTGEEWALVYETKVHGLFFNTVTKDIKRYKRNEYTHYVNIFGKYKRTKFKETEDFIKINEKILTHPDGYITRTVSNDSNNMKYDDFEVIHYYVDKNGIPMVYGKYRSLTFKNVPYSTDEIANMRADKLKSYTLMINFGVLDDI